MTAPNDNDLPLARAEYRYQLARELLREASEKMKEAVMAVNDARPDVIYAWFRECYPHYAPYINVIIDSKDNSQKPSPYNAMISYEINGMISYEINGGSVYNMSYTIEIAYPIETEAYCKIVEELNHYLESIARVPRK